jgi:hypothetical protein
MIKILIVNKMLAGLAEPRQAIHNSFSRSSSNTLTVFLFPSRKEKRKQNLNQNYTGNLRLVRLFAGSVKSCATWVEVRR